jgi:hypothetical protein
MTFAAPEPDPEEGMRVHAALVAGDRVTCERLRSAAAPRSYEFVFLRRDPATFDTADRLMLTRMAWHYRRRLPSHLRPTTNPDDPIVRESEFQDGD